MKEKEKKTMHTSQKTLKRPETEAALEKSLLLSELAARSGLSDPAQLQAAAGLARLGASLGPPGALLAYLEASAGVSRPLFPASSPLIVPDVIDE